MIKGANLTGFEVRPATVSGVQGVAPSVSLDLPRLWELVVKGQAGEAKPESGIRLIYECPYCGMKRYSSFANGIVVDDAAWDGSDFFTVAGYPRFILVTNRVTDLIVKSQFANCMLIPTEELRWTSLSKPEDINYEAT
jgi:hypothetical protein